jgi:hypothetical protein
MTNYSITPGNIYSSTAATACGTAVPAIYTGLTNTLNITGTLNTNITYGTGGTTTWTLAPWALSSPTPEIIECMIQNLTTTVKPGEKVVVCVDDDMTWEQVHEIQQGLQDNHVPGIVIRGARAGTGFNDGYLPPTAEEARIDILARLGELWGKIPQLRLTDLLAWYNGDSMSDEEFITSAEIYFTKVTNGIHRRS